MIKIETLPSLLSYYAIQNPNALCIKCECREYSYKEIDEITNGIAQYLLDKGVKRNTPVGIIGTRSELIPIFILSILKTGAHYVPLNDTFPFERLNYICIDANIRYVLSDEVTLKKAESLENVEVLNINIENLLSLKNNSLKHIEMNPSDTMAIYYTSGSSGTPKGVVHSIYSILISNYYDYLEFSIQEKDSMLLFTHWSICFSVTIFSGFISGSSIYIASNQQCCSLSQLDDYVKKNRITIIHMPTQVGFQYCQISVSNSIRLLILGGSSFPKLSKVPTFRIVNVYGSTEGMALSYQNCNEHYKSSSLGYKCDHCEWIIIDEKNCTVAHPRSGELLICGPSLSKGYLNSPELNKERYFMYKGKRVFNTKDIVRQELDGSYTYLGRADKMIKIRGQRIDITEIEDIILQFENITQCCISTITTSNNIQLCGYFVANSIIDISHLKKHIKRHLPEYMLPMYLIQMNSLPLTERGKIDYASLPQPQLNNNIHYIASTKEGFLIAKITKKILKTNAISLDLSFRDLGGDSLTFLLFNSELTNYGYSLPYMVNAINSPLAEIANIITPNNRKICSDNFEKKGEVNSLCKYLIDRNKGKKINLFIVHDILKSKYKLEKTIIKQTLVLLLKKHSILKCIVDSEGNLQYKDEHSVECCLQCVTCQSNSKKSITRLINKFFESFDIHKSLFKVLFIRNKGNDLIVLGTHHLISDAISKRIIHNDFCFIYSNLIENIELSISNKDSIDFISYKKYLKQIYKTDLFTEDLIYWNNIRNKISQSGCIISSSSKNECSFLFTTYKIPPEESKKIIQKSKDYKFGILVPSIYVLNLIVGQKDAFQNCFQIIRHGRNHSIANLSKSFSVNLYETIGCFAFSHPIFIDNESDIDQIENVLSNIPNEGIGFDVSGGYYDKEIPIYGIDIVGNSDYQKIDSKYFEKATGINGLKPTHPNLNIGCQFLIYVNVHKNEIILTVRYDTSLFTEESVLEILKKISLLMSQISN